jgi:hypothetical protein
MAIINRKFTLASQGIFLIKKNARVFNAKQIFKNSFFECFLKEMNS